MGDRERERGDIEQKSTLGFGRVLLLHFGSVVDRITVILNGGVA